MSQSITVNDQARTYKSNVGGPFANEAKKGNATTFSAVLTPSTNVPEVGVSDMLRKTLGGSGTLAGSQKMRDVLTDVSDPLVKYLYIAGVHMSMPDNGDFTHLGDMLTATVTELTANSCAKLRELLSGVHDG